jgi:hypothetical protein
VARARTGNRKGLIGAIALGLLAVLMLASAGRAMAAWGPPVPLAAEGREPQVATDPAGDAVLVFRRFEYGFGGNYRLFATDKAAGGEWSAPVAISAEGKRTGIPSVALDKSGNAIIVWSAETITEAAYKPAGGSWEAPVPISFGLQAQRDAHVAFDSAGEATAVWARTNPEGTEIIQSATKPAGGSWGTPVNVSAGPQSSDGPLIAYDGSGDAVAAWTHRAGEESTVIQAASKPAGGHWGPAISLDTASEEVVNYATGLAVDPAGDATVLWTSRSAGSRGFQAVIQASRLPAGGTWSPPVDVSPVGQSPSSGEQLAPALAVDGAGNATAIWIDIDGEGNRSVEVSDRPAGGSWLAPQVISPAGQKPDRVQIGVDAAGNETAAWVDAPVLSHGPIEARRRPQGGTWQRMVDVSAAGEGASLPRLAVAANGTAYLGWTRETEFEEGAPSVAEFDPSTVEGPLITVEPAVAPRLWGGGGGSSTISVSATDEGGIARVFAEVGLPHGGETEVPLSPAGGDRYTATYAVPYNSGTKAVQYPVTVVVEDNAGRTAGGPAGTITVEPKAVPNPGYLAIEPSKVMFGPVSLGHGESRERTFVLHNPGKPGSPTVTGTLESSDPQFTLPEGGGAGVPYALAPGASRTFRVVFAPTTAGQRQAQISLGRTDGRQVKTDVLLFGRGE